MSVCVYVCEQVLVAQTVFSSLAEGPRVVQSHPVVLGTATEAVNTVNA